MNAIYRTIAMDHSVRYGRGWYIVRTAYGDKWRGIMISYNGVELWLAPHL